MVVVPGRVAAELFDHSTKSHRNEQLPETLLLHRPNEPFDDSEAGWLAEESEAATYSPSPTPAFVRPTRELSPLVGHDAPRQVFLLADRLAEEGLDLSRCRHLREHRVVIVGASASAPIWGEIRIAALPAHQSGLGWKRNQILR
jgi:hypothetical protein